MRLSCREARTADSASEASARSITHEWWEVVMDVLYERCCGLDVHKKLVVACVITTPSDGEPERIVQSFGTMTEDLLKLGEWLEACGVSHVAMGSTGVYWQPIWNLLEDRFTPMLAH